MTQKSNKTRALTEEEILKAASYLAQTASALGREIAAKNLSQDHEPRNSLFPDISEDLDEALINVLEDEVIPIEDLDQGSIDQSEVDREVIKKALIGLKLSDLKEVAEAEGIKISGNMEQIASSIARKYGWEKQEVAELVLRHSGDSGVEHGHVTRLFPLAPDVQVSGCRERLRDMTGRYIRTGVAKWFLFGELLESAENSVAVMGNFKTYEATIDTEGNGADLTALPKNHAVKIRLGEDGVLEVQGSDATTARHAAKAFSFVADATLVKPNYTENFALLSKDAVFNPITDYILDIIITRLNLDNFLDINPRVARFDMKNQSEEESSDLPPLETRRSELKSIKFDGNYLLDSAETSRIIFQEKKSLKQILFDVVFCREKSAKNYVYPVRITADRDHISVQTGLGTENCELSQTVHHKVVESVVDATLNGISSTSNLENLSLEMSQRLENSK